MNFSIHDSSWHSPYSIVWQGIVWLVVFALSLETIIGNAMVIVAYKIERSISKQVSNRYIVSLAISDLIIGIEGFPLFTVYVLNGQRWPLGAIACETWLFLDYTLCLVSILTVLLITADRYLSVCHTAKYLRWQSPTKTWVLIIFSWVIPAFIFGLMIYGWNIMGGSSVSMTGGECSAPFLTNPYVNMGMYVAYYWTTLVAMLILYKGIHQAAKNLEKKAKAKERRHIALILSQRLGTQVGVSLMLQSRNEKEKQEAQKKKKLGRRWGFAEPEKTENEKTLLKVTRVEEEDDKNLTVIEEERSNLESFYRRESRELPLPAPNSSETNSRRQSEEQEALLQNQYDSVVVTNRARLSLKSNASRCSITDSLKKRDIASFKSTPQPANRDSGNDSDNSSHSVKIRRSHREKRRSANHSRRSNHINRSRDTSKRSKASTSTDRPPVEESPRNVRWVTTMKKRIARALERRVSSRRRERSSSSSSTSSSGEGYPAPSVTSSSTAPKAPVPQLIVTEQPEIVISEEPAAVVVPVQEEKRPDSALLSTAGSQRKLSTLSTSITREKLISSIFAPISIFNRRRKQTKAEKRAHKAFRTITFIVGCFAILWSPYYIMATVYGFCKGECIPDFLYTLSYYMCYLNSSGNPFAYALANRQFRSAFLRMFRGNFRKIT